MSYQPGQWLAICDRCGRQFLSNKLKLMWNGLRVDARCWEERHPQDFVRPIVEKNVPWTSPEPEDISIDPFLYIDAFYFEHLDSSGNPQFYFYDSPAGV
jgi:hypothetical protein